VGAPKQMFPHHKSNGCILKFKSMGNPKQLFLLAKVMGVSILMGNSKQMLLKHKSNESVQKFVILCVIQNKCFLVTKVMKMVC
jgi:hypothetical protein